MLCSAGSVVLSSALEALGIDDNTGVGEGTAFNAVVALADKNCLSSTVSEIEANTRDLASLSPSSSCVVSLVETC